MRLAVDRLLDAAGDPELAHSQWEDLRSHLPPRWMKEKGTSSLLSLLGNSPFLVRYLLHHTNLIKELVFSPFLTRPKDLRRMTLDLRLLFARQFAGDLASAQALLRRYKYAEMARIAIRDLSGSPFEEIGSELSRLAQVSVEFACRAVLLPIKNFGVIGLGKLGGEDLNFSSDIDILYTYGKTEKGFDFFSRVAEGITRTLQERTGEGIVFRVDLGLRPEGRSGSVVHSVDALVSYYEVSGAPWERSVWIKGRPIAGDRKIGEEVLKRLEPFVYPRHTELSVVRDLKRMKEKIDREQKKKGGFHVKLGRGGIREIEFFVSAFQLLLGGKNQDLRERNTLRALDRLRSHQLVPVADVRRQKEAYIFFRRIENRLQMEEERQTHAIPSDSQELKSLARKMGFSEPDLFLESVREKSEFVHQCFERLAT